MVIELTAEEANVLVQLIDAAVRANGLQAAEAGLVMTHRIQQAAQAEAPVEAEAEVVAK